MAGVEFITAALAFWLAILSFFPFETKLNRYPAGAPEVRVMPYTKVVPPPSEPPKLLEENRAFDEQPPAWKPAEVVHPVVKTVAPVPAVVKHEFQPTAVVKLEEISEASQKIGTKARVLAPTTAAHSKGIVARPVATSELKETATPPAILFRGPTP